MMKCGNCQKGLDEEKDRLWLDDDLTVFCSQHCSERGLNLGKIFSEIHRNMKGWTHTREFWKTYDALYYETEQKVVDVCIGLFKKLDLGDSDPKVERAKNILRTLTRTGRMTTKQKQCLCHFVAYVRENADLFRKKAA